MVGKIELGEISTVAKTTRVATMRVSTAKPPTSVRWSTAARLAENKMVHKYPAKSSTMASDREARREFCEEHFGNRDLTEQIKSRLRSSGWLNRRDASRLPRSRMTR